MSRTKKGAENREPMDRYFTPTKYPRRLFDQVLFPWWKTERREGEGWTGDYDRAPGPVRVLEPGCGEGVHLHEARRVFPESRVVGVDLADEIGGPEGQLFGGVDFLTWSWDGPLFDLVVTNPPYILAQEFIDKALTVAHPDGLVVMLLRLNFKGSQAREDWWRTGGGRTFASDYAMPDRPSFRGKGSDACEYAYFIFEPWRLTRAHRVLLPPSTHHWLWRTRTEIDAYRPPPRVKAGPLYTLDERSLVWPDKK